MHPSAGPLPLALGLALAAHHGIARPPERVRADEVRLPLGEAAALPQRSPDQLEVRLVLGLVEGLVGDLAVGLGKSCVPPRVGVVYDAREEEVEIKTDGSLKYSEYLEDRYGEQIYGLQPKFLKQFYNRFIKKRVKRLVKKAVK